MRMDDLKRWADVKPGYWFAPKLFGWGATPVTWQGWALTLAYVAVLMAVLTGLDDPWRWLFVVPVTIVVVAIAWRKTEGGWRWRWGVRH